MALIRLDWCKRPIGRALYGLERLIRRFHQYNPIKRARGHVAHHDDLSDDLYDLFLDADRQYSCGYFTEKQGDFDRAQLDKKRHLAAKLMIDTAKRALDIGSGWGGLGARRHGSDGGSGVTRDLGASLQSC
ncbi:MAG: SAM-dependent methyltransferase [Geminicoccaceae bacterium]